MSFCEKFQSPKKIFDKIDQNSVYTFKKTLYVFYVVFVFYHNTNFQNFKFLHYGLYALHNMYKIYTSAYIRFVALLVLMGCIQNNTRFTWIETVKQDIGRLKHGLRDADDYIYGLCALLHILQFLQPYRL